jgi:Flp pilus assembly pilin Flp
MKARSHRKSGQTMVEYIIIVVIIAIAAIAIFGVFGDTIRSKLGGAVTELDPDNSAVGAALQDSGRKMLEDLGDDIADNSKGGSN